ncbi:hypothetical protein LCGC14_0315820 [marine sediment metagenome]|uniref:Zinc-ribbon domain-containing protein n=1 Tax=marine sediment metagenome TaxID=412755 RepID=A0A0F9W847_9ZZZZ
MSTIVCPHCQAENPPEAAFCEACGKAVPQTTDGPRIVEGNQLAVTSSGRAVQADLLHKAARRAATPLIVLGVLQIAIGIALFLINRNSDDADVVAAAPIMLAILSLIGVLFLGLGLWARKNPLPASIVGLVVYCTLIVAGALLNPATIIQGILIKIIIILVLVRSVGAGLKYKKLKAQTVYGADAPAAD